MRLYLVRHGQAKSKSEDPQRPLSDVGLLNVKKVASFLKPLRLIVKAVWHSGKARAAQTADILATAVTVQDGVQEREGLSPDDPIGPVSKELKNSDHDLMIVGHLPFVNDLASALLAGEAGVEMLAFSCGSVCCLEREEDGHWQLLWMIRPEILP